MVDPMSQLVLAGTVSLVMQKLKTSAVFPFITRSTDKLNLLISLLLAFATHLGISYQFNHDTGVLVVNGLIWSNIARTAWGVGQQFVLQELTYRGAIKPADRAALVRSTDPAPKV